MSMDAQSTFLMRLARRPFPIFLGLAVGLLACCIAGRVAARKHTFANFVRFNVGNTSHTHYYPTFAQVLNVSRQHVKPGKVIVVVAGSSIFNGVGQRLDYVWTRRLQELLGDNYVVLNLAIASGSSQEIGGLIADIFTTEGVPVVLLSCGTLGEWDGLLYRYFFWDAWGKGAVPPDPRRDQWLANEFAANNADKDKILEYRRAGLVDGATYSKDLWSYVAYNYRGTVWTPYKYPKWFWQPHYQIADNDPGALIPFEAYNNPSMETRVLPVIRKVIETRRKALAEGDEALKAAHEAYFTDRLLDRTIHVIPIHGPYYRKRLSVEEQKTYDEVHRGTRDALLRMGLHAQLIGENYEERDYSDATHIGEPGAKKMAEELAPSIRKLSEQLYVRPEKSR